MSDFKRFLKDWCRDCKNRDYAKECYYCLYLDLREVRLGQPSKWEDKNK